MTLANERVAMSSGGTFGIGVESVLRLAGGGPRSPPSLDGVPPRRPAGRGPVPSPDDPPVDIPGPCRHRPRAGGQSAQTARRRTPAAGPAAGAPLLGPEGATLEGGRPDGPRACSPPAVSRWPEEPARFSAT